MSSQSCCRVFIDNWLPRFGIPDSVVTDRGSQFMGGVWKELMETLGVMTPVSYTHLTLPTIYSV